MRIITNWHRRELVTFEEAGCPEDFNYITGDDRYEPRLFRYRGAWYDLNDGFVACNRDGATNHMHMNLPGWDGFQADTYFSGVAVKILNGDDDGFIVAALVLN